MAASKMLSLSLISVWPFLAFLDFDSVGEVGCCESDEVARLLVEVAGSSNTISSSQSDSITGEET